MIEELVYTVLDLGVIGQLPIMASNAALTRLADPSSISKTSLKVVGMPHPAAVTLNMAAEVFADPNIAGIPIKATAEDIVRQVDVSKQMVIIQSANGGKEWTTDNAAPQPRTFQVEGYLRSLSALTDMGLIWKPSLAMQMWWLDVCAKSRRPVIYKTYYNTFVQCLIENLQFHHAPEAQNVIKVSCSLSEWVPYDASTGAVSTGKQAMETVTGVAYDV